LAFAGPRHPFGSRRANGTRIGNQPDAEPASKQGPPRVAPAASGPGSDRNPAAPQSHPAAIKENLILSAAFAAAAAVAVSVIVAFDL
tara:strand:+ start:8762 stop:9022 length:261 start_codon:yes stop_codon:yes gene_type:complete